MKVFFTGDCVRFVRQSQSLRRLYRRRVHRLSLDQAVQQVDRIWPRAGVVGRKESADSHRELRERGRSVGCRAAAWADAAAVVRLAS